MLINYKENPK